MLFVGLGLSQTLPALTGVFILIVRKLIDGVPEAPAAEAAQRIDERRRRLKGAPLEDLVDTVHEGHRC